MVTDLRFCQNGTTSREIRGEDRFNRAGSFCMTQHPITPNQQSRPFSKSSLPTAPRSRPIIDSRNYSDEFQSFDGQEGREEG